MTKPSSAPLFLIYSLIKVFDSSWLINHQLVMNITLCCDAGFWVIMVVWNVIDENKISLLRGIFCYAPAHKIDIHIPHHDQSITVVYYSNWKTTSSYTLFLLWLRLGSSVNKFFNFFWWSFFKPNHGSTLRDQDWW